jgi:hypothetical protein
MLPGFSATINSFEDRPNLMEEFVIIVSDISFCLDLICSYNFEIVENARHARSEDIYKIHTRGIRHILVDDFESQRFDPPLDPYGDKIHRGWNHPQTARSLCPMHSLAAFDDDPVYVITTLAAGRFIQPV